MAPKLQERNFVFVGGPVLTAKERGIRSKVVQAGMREKRLERQQSAVAEINKLLEARSSACNCRRISAPLARKPIPAGARGFQLDEAQLQVGSVCCPFCGRYIRSFGAHFSRASLHDIGSGVDPTIPVNETTSRLRVHEIFSYACKHILPYLHGSLDLPDLYQTWAFPFDNDELKLYTILWASKRHEDVMRLTCNMPPTTTELKEQLVLKGLTLKILHKEIASYRGHKAIDSIIKCMLVLAVNDVEIANQRLSWDSSPFTPSLTGFHALELYDARVYNGLYWQNMYKLLDNYSGIQVLHLFGLAWQISVADLINAVYKL
jgi:hypothetical protein